MQKNSDILLHPTYFPSIAVFVAIANAESVTYEVCDNYQKQTYRNRMNIYGSNGKLPLAVPVIYTQKNRQLYKDILIHNEQDWQDLHWKSIRSSYSNSPFFEFYEHDLLPIFRSKFKYLLDLNFKCLEIVHDCLELPLKFETTKVYHKDIDTLTDLRTLVDNRKEKEQVFASYVQVFDDRQGFLPNLSILDLICNEGPNALLYIESQSLAE